MMTKLKSIIVILLVTAIFLPPQINANAQTVPGQRGYVLLETIGQLQKGQSVTFDQYLENLYQFILRLAALLGIIMLVLAGIEYTSAGLSEKLKTDAKTRAWSAILGLFLALSAYLILNTLNPDLLKFDLRFKNLTPPDKSGS